MYSIYNYVVVVSGDERSKNRLRRPGTGTKTTRNCPWSMRSRSQWNRISKDFDNRALVVTRDDCGWLRVPPKVGEDLALVDGDPSGSKESGVLGLHDEGHYYGDLGGVG